MQNEKINRGHVLGALNTLENLGREKHGYAHVAGTCLGLLSALSLDLTPTQLANMHSMIIRSINTYNTWNLTMKEIKEYDENSNQIHIRNSYGYEWWA